MSSLRSRLRGALGLGLLWGVTWALAGLAIGVLSLLTPWLPWATVFAIWDAPLPALAVPGFVGGLCFSLVLGTAARHRPLETLSTARFALWGALGGVLLSLVPTTLVLLGLATLRPDVNVWWLTLVTGVPFTVLASASAAGTRRLARVGPALPPAEPSPALDRGQR